MLQLVHVALHRYNHEMALLQKGTSVYMQKQAAQIQRHALPPQL